MGKNINEMLKSFAKFGLILFFACCAVILVGFRHKLKTPKLSKQKEQVSMFDRYYIPVIKDSIIDLIKEEPEINYKMFSEDNIDADSILQLKMKNEIEAQKLLTDQTNYVDAYLEVDSSLISGNVIHLKVIGDTVFCPIILMYEILYNKEQSMLK